MNDSSLLANALSEPLRDPFWWAALASVSLHGVLGVNAPKISNLIYGGNSSKNLPGSVGLVELTSAEVGRLPQSIPPLRSNLKSPLSIAPVPLPRNLTPPLPPAPTTAINLPALPPGMPPPGFFSPLPSSPLPSLSPPPLPKNPPSPTATTPSQRQQTDTPRPQLSPTIDPLNTQQLPPPPPPIPLPLLPPQTSDRQEKDEAETYQQTIDRNKVPDLSDPNKINEPQYPKRNSASKVDEPPSETPEEKERRLEFERGQQKLNEQRQPEPNLSSDSNKNIAAGNTYLALFEEFKKAYPDLEMTALTPVNVAYPKAACSQKLEGKAVLGAVVNPQGTIIASPRMTVPTTSSILNNAAQTAMLQTSLTFPPASTNKLYHLTVEFKYDEKVCRDIPGTPSTAPTPSPAVQQSPSKNPTQVEPQFEKQPPDSNKPKPGVKQSPSPQPKPGAKQSPSPQPQPGARDLMLPEPQPAGAESPIPQPQPAAEESPTPPPAVSPTTEPSPVVSPTASPVAAPSPTASPSPAASP